MATINIQVKDEPIKTKEVGRNQKNDDGADTNMLKVFKKI